MENHKKDKNIFIVSGSACSGKNTYIEQNKRDFLNRRNQPLFSSESINNIMKPFRSSGSLTPTVTGPALEEQYQDDAAQSLSRYKQTSEYNNEDIKPIIESLSPETIKVTKQKVINAAK